MVNLSQKRKLAKLLGKISPEGLDSSVVEGVLAEVEKVKNEIPTIPEPVDVSTIYTEIRDLFAKLQTQEELSTEEKKNVDTRIKELQQEIEKLTDKKIEALRLEISQRFSNLGGGAMNRKITVAGVDVLKNYTDINFVSGITTAIDNVNKRVNFTLTGGGGTPAGSNTQIQFNDNGAFGASSSLTWNGTTLSTPSLTDTGLTATRITFAGTGGLLTGSANFTYTTGSFDIFAFVGVQTINRNSIANTSTSALGLRNGTLSTSGSQLQWSPRLGFTAHVWDGFDTAPFWYMENQATNGTSTPATVAGGNLNFGYSTFGGGGNPSAVVFSGPYTSVGIAKSPSTDNGSIDVLGKLKTDELLVFSGARSVTPPAYSIANATNSTVDSGSHMQLTGGSAGFKFRNYNDTATFLSITADGDASLRGQITFGGLGGTPAAFTISNNYVGGGLELQFNGGTGGFLWKDSYNAATLMSLDNAGNVIIPIGTLIVSAGTFTVSSAVSYLNGGIDINSSAFTIDTSGLHYFTLSAGNPGPLPSMSSFTNVYGIADGTICGTAEYWLPVMINGTQYVIPAYLQYQP